MLKALVFKCSLLFYLLYVYIYDFYIEHLVVILAMNFVELHFEVFRVIVISCIIEYSLAYM